MSSLFASRAFTSFGPSALAVAPPVLYQVHGRRPSTLRAKVRQECPRRPGVYGMVSARGELIYVG